MVIEVQAKLSIVPETPTRVDTNTVTCDQPVLLSLIVQQTPRVTFGLHAQKQARTHRMSANYHQYVLKQGGVEQKRKSKI